MYLKKRIISIAVGLFALFIFSINSNVLAADPVNIFIEDVEVTGNTGSFYISMNVPVGQEITKIWIPYLEFDATSLDITKYDIHAENAVVATWSDPILFDTEDPTDEPVIISTTWWIWFIEFYCWRNLISEPEEQWLLWTGEDQRIFKVDFRIKPTATLPTTIYLNGIESQNIILKDASQDVPFITSNESLITKWAFLALLTGNINTLGSDIPVDGFLNNGEVLFGAMKQEIMTDENGQFSLTGISNSSDLALLVRKDGYESRIIDLRNKDVASNWYTLNDGLSYDLENKLKLKGDHYGKNTVLGVNNSSEPDGVLAIGDAVWLYKYLQNLFNPTLNYELANVETLVEWAGSNFNPGEISGVIKEMWSDDLLADASLYLLEIIDVVDIDAGGDFGFVDNLNGETLMIIKADDYVTKTIKLASESNVDYVFTSAELSLQLNNDFYGKNTVNITPDWNNYFEEGYLSESNGLFDVDDITYIYNNYQNGLNYPFLTSSIDWLVKN